MLPQAPPTTSGMESKDTAEVEKLILQLEQNLESAKLSLNQLDTILERLKILGRDVNTAGPIFTERGIKTISKYGFDRTRGTVSLEALRCLANAFLLDEPSRQLFVDLGFASQAAERLKFDQRDDEFLICRILFLLTYNTNVDFESLVNKNQLAESINAHLASHAKLFNSKSGRRKSETSPNIDLAMTETLKLTFNITYYYPDLVSRFDAAIEPLISLLLTHPLSNPPLQSPITYILNALLNLDLGAAGKKTPIGPQARSSPLFPYSKPESVAERLTSIFNKAIMYMPEKELDAAAAPLCTLIRRVYALAYPQMREWMQCVMLPQATDRDKPLGQGDTMASRLLRLSCSPSCPILRDNVSGLLFELSDKDAERFVRNIGYGFASGFLMSHGIEIPGSAAEAGSTRTDGTEGSTGGGGGSGALEELVGVNPITGQRWDAEERDRARATAEGGNEEREMTEEEKEREAERLFVLFERLKATGVVDVKNPVQQAIDEGRFEELD